jgi:hypothetical protein
VTGVEANAKLAEAFSLKMSEPLLASNDSATPASSLTGVYSQAQARKGAETYRRYCGDVPRSGLTQRRGISNGLGRPQRC